MRELGLAGRQHGARADQDLRHLVGDRPDRLEGDRRTQGELDDRQAAGDQRPGQRYGGRDVVDDHDRDDRHPVEEGGDSDGLDNGNLLLGSAVRREHAGSHVGGADGGAERGEELAAGTGPLLALGCGPWGDRSDRWTPSRSSGPATASTVIRSPSRTRESGPSSAASGVTWIAAGTLPDAPDIRPSVTIATSLPAVLEYAERGRQLVQLGHPVGGRALVADDRHEVAAVELLGRERLEEVGLVVEDDGGRGDHPVLGLDRGHLDHAGAERAAQHLEAAVDENGSSAGRSTSRSRLCFGPSSQVSSPPRSFGSVV